MKIALVTGASSGLGRECVRQIAEQGKVEEIWASARRRDRLEALQSISAVPIRVLALDLTRPGISTVGPMRPMPAALTKMRMSGSSSCRVLRR